MRGVVCDHALACEQSAGPMVALPRATRFRAFAAANPIPAACGWPDV